ncbi:hypothetical protein RBB50_010144 [Rhinocladiella similis]
MRTSILLSTTILASAALVASECCHADTYEFLTRIWSCADGKEISPFECCAYGSCNIFCCNCSGACRKVNPKRTEARDIVRWKDFQGDDPKGGPLETDNQCAFDAFEALDTNHDRVVSLTEALAGISVFRPFLNLAEIDEATIQRDFLILFNTYDTDKSGNLTLSEAITPQKVNFEV